MQRVASLLAEARALMGEDRLSEAEDSPLRKAKNPRDLALLVKRYRLIEASVSSVLGLSLCVFFYYGHVHLKLDIGSPSVL